MTDVIADLFERQKRARRDFRYFVTDILGYKDLGEIHWELIKWDELTRRKGPNRRLILVPRGHFKSTVMTYAQILHEIVLTHGVDGNGKERCIGLCSWDLESARGFLREIKWHFEENQEFRTTFPDICWENPRQESREKGFDWTKEAITVDGRKKPRKECTVEAFSLESLPTGKHFDLIIGDDIVTEKNSETATGLRDTARKMELLTPLLVRLDDRIDLVGTIYNFGDYHSYMRDIALSQKDRGVPETVSLFYRPAAVEDNNDIKDPIFPERFPIDLLRTLRAQSPEMFASQYMLNPRHNSRDRFDRDDFKFYTKDELARAGIGFKVMYVDPARSTTKYSDYTACAVIGVGYNRRIYLLDGFRERLTSDEMAGKLASLYERWRPNVSHAEKNGLEQFLKPALKLYGFEKFTGVTSHGEKVDRIRSIHGYVRRGMLWLSSEPQWRTTPEGQRYDLVHEFLKEAIGFPHGEHDDFLDALQGALRASGVKVSEPGIAAEEETRLAMIARKILPRRPAKKTPDPVFGRYGSNW